MSVIDIVFRFDKANDKAHDQGSEEELMERLMVGWMGLVVLAGAVGASVVAPRLYFLNGQVYPASVAPAYHVLPGVPVEWNALLCPPGTNDVLGYVARSETVTCRTAASGLLVCSDGQEIAGDGLTVQQLFQRLAENYAILHTPQHAPRRLPVSTVGELRLNDTVEYELEIPNLAEPPAE